MLKDPTDERAERDLMELYKMREQTAAALKVAVGPQIAVGQALLRKIDADIEKWESAMAPVQKAEADLDVSLVARRQQALDLLPTLDKLEKEPTLPPAALPKIAETRAATRKFLQDDALERGIPNTDH